MFVIAGHQGGKTSFGARWLYREIDRCGPGDYLAVTATYDLFKLKMLPECMAVFCRSGWGEYQATDRVIVSKDRRTRIILRSAQSPGGLESATAQAAWLDECGQDDFDIGAWEAVLRRLSIAEGRLLGTTTPYNLGWLKQQVFDRYIGGDPAFQVVQFRSCDNPAFPIAEYERMQQVLPKWKFAMFYDGEFSRPAGLIYSDYEDSYCELTPVMEDIPGEFGTIKETRLARFNKQGSGHLVRPFTIPGYWMRTLGIDFGPVNEARLWLAEEPQTGCYYAYRERLGGGLSGPEYAREALEYKEPLRGVWGGAKSEAERRREWQMAGLPVAEPVITDVEAGIDHVIGLFRQHRLFVFDTLTGLRSELGTYSREVDDAGEPTAKIADKRKFHLLDALRAGAGAWPIDAPTPKAPDLPPPPGRTPAMIKAREAWYNRHRTARKGSEEY